MSYETIDAVLDTNWPSRVKMCALVIGRHENKQGDSWPGLALRMRRCGYCEKTDRRCIKWLVNAGHLTVTPDATKGQIFRLSLPENLSKNRDKNSANPDKNSKNRDKNSGALKEEELKKNEKAGFQSFWDLWPDTTNKNHVDPCKKIWLENRLCLESERILQHVQSVIIGSNNAIDNDGQYLLGPRTYLSDAAWRKPFAIKINGRPACHCGAAAHQQRGAVWLCDLHADEAYEREMGR